MKRLLTAVCVLALALCVSCGGTTEPSDPSETLESSESLESSETSVLSDPSETSSASAPSDPSLDEETSFPPAEAILLVYTDHISRTIGTRSDEKSTCGFARFVVE